MGQGVVGEALRNLRDVRYWLENGLIDVSGAETDQETGAHVLARHGGWLLRQVGYLSIFPPYQQHQAAGTGSLPRSNITFSYTVLQPNGHNGDTGARDLYSARDGVYVLATAPKLLSLETVLNRESWIGRAASQSLVEVVDASKVDSATLAPHLVEMLAQAAAGARSTAFERHVGQVN